jgi:hypothetical protein
VDKGPSEALERKKIPVEFFPLGGQKPGLYRDARLPQGPHAAAVYPGVRVKIRDDYALYAAFDDKPRTGRLVFLRGSKRAGFQGAVQGRALEGFPPTAGGGYGIGLRMGAAVTPVPALADKASFPGDNRAHKRIGGSFSRSPPRKSKSALHAAYIKGRKFRIPAVHKEPNASLRKKFFGIFREGAVKLFFPKTKNPQGESCPP